MRVSEPATATPPTGPSSTAPGAPLPPPAPQLVPTLWRVVAVTPEIRDTVTLDVAPPCPDDLSVVPAPGQFMMLSRFGLGEAAISVSGISVTSATSTTSTTSTTSVTWATSATSGVVRGSGSRRSGPTDQARRPPEARARLRHTVRAAGALTRDLAAVGPGDLVGVRGPFGTGWGLDRATGRDVVVVAGGIGLAPLRPVVQTLLARRAMVGRLAVLVGARTPADLLYPAELHGWRARFDLDLLVTVDRASPGWSGDVGVVSSLIRRLAVDAGNTVAFVCGPEPMMRFTAAALTSQGIPEHRIELSLERNMRCGVGLCGHCQLGPVLLCRDGPVVRYDRVRALLPAREV